MLGNFSFGDYFKAEAIEFAWDLITKDYGLPKDSSTSPFSARTTKPKSSGRRSPAFPRDRIFRLDEKDNFWQMGETGPCGPCSEIHYDLGPEAAEPGPRARAVSRATPAAASSRSGTSSSCSTTATSNGKLTPLPRPSIDTGMGLERVAAVMQGKLSNYETDLIRPIIDRAAELFELRYGDDDRGRHRAAHRRRPRPRHRLPDPRWRAARPTKAAATCCARSCAAPCAMPA